MYTRIEGDKMPLSEREQRLLEEMERSLYHNDAEHVATVGGPKGRPQSRSIVFGVLLAVLGIAALVTGVSLQMTVLSIIIGVIGFLALFGGVLLAVTPSRRASVPGPDAQNAGSHPKPQAAAQQGFMDKLNDRWDKRDHG